MSWQAGCFLLLGVVLLGGFAWYERSRPPAQIVALVAALAALAVAGRVAFPVIPNVVATTDIVFFCGYAIGAAPGFAVGAFAGLVSNFWLGQGPWTPWQMAGWGMCGVAGAGLAALSGRRLGRFSLAAACGVLGFAYGALLDFSLMVTYGGEQSLDRFLALSARGVPFNVAHAAGNVAIALAAGPALVRMLIRFRERFEVEWRPRAVEKRERRLATGAAVLMVTAGIAAGSLTAPDARGAGGRQSAAAWLKASKNSDGGYGTEPGGSSSPGMTGWAALGLEGAGVNPLDLGPSTKTPIAYLRKNAGSVRTVGDLERTILVLRGAGLGARGFGGRNLVRELRRQRGSDGSWGGQVNATAFGILALEAAGVSGNEGSAAWLRGVQNPDGGWGFAERTASDADSTGAAMQGLAAAGSSSASLSKAASYLRSSQQSGGGFALSGGSSNSQSTAWAVQGLIAAGADPASFRNGGTPLGYLGARQASDGHYRYSASSDQTPVWVTGQALDAVYMRPFPLAPVARTKTGNSKGGAGGGSGAAPASPHASSQGGTAGGSGQPGARQAGTAPAVTQPGSLPTGPTGPTPTGATGPTAGGDESGGGGDSKWIALGGLALAGLTWGGWVYYRRRLP